MFWLYFIVKVGEMFFILGVGKIIVEYKIGQ